LRSLAYTWTVAICTSAISTPGTMPARNRPPIETVSRPPHTIMRIEGGTITARTADTAVMATEKLSW
jgi:hypothetical protein